MRSLSLFFSTLLLVSCATLRPLPSEGPVRVLNFALSKTVALGGPMGKSEFRPGILGGDIEHFEQPIKWGIERMWEGFSDRASALTGRGPWLAPASPEGPAPASYAEVGESGARISELSLNYSAARGLLWPQEFQYVTSDAVLKAEEGFSESLFLTVEYRAFLVPSAVASDAEYAFRVGIDARLALYDREGLLRSDRFVGFSTSTGAKMGQSYERGKYPDLMAEAQDDVLSQWAKSDAFRTVR